MALHANVRMIAFVINHLLLLNLKIIQIARLVKVMAPDMLLGIIAKKQEMALLCVLSKVHATFQVIVD